MDSDLTALGLDGALTTHPADLAAVADDWGHIVSHRPRAVLRPRSPADIAATLRFAGEHGIPVVPRGEGHTSYGQAQCPDGIVIAMSHLARIHHITPDRVTVDAGATWADLLTATLRHQLTPPVLTDYLGLSIGGTLSAGGIGGTSHRHGAQTDTVLELDVITGDGTQHTCSPHHDPDLFHAALAGLGRHG
ncbi:FAD-binding protein, partial [Amycolatopsis rhizosphaerae]